MSNMRCAVWRHVKSGNLYFVPDEGVPRIEKDNTRAVRYMCLKTGQAWVRPTKEFFDGRFVQLTVDELDAMKGA